MQTLDIYFLMDKTVKLLKFTVLFSSAEQDWMSAD